MARANKKNELGQLGAVPGDQEEPEIVRIEDIPDNPLAMPPPYWRSSGAIFHVSVALRGMLKSLAKLPGVLARTNARLDKHYEAYPGDNPDRVDALREFGDICDEFWKLEHAIKLESEYAILTASITAEDEINQFCVFNLHRDIAEDIERLSLPEKLLVASGILGKHGVKNTNTYEQARKLTGRVCPRPLRRPACEIPSAQPPHFT